MKSCVFSQTDRFPSTEKISRFDGHMLMLWSCEVLCDTEKEKSKGNRESFLFHCHPLHQVFKGREKEKHKTVLQIALAFESLQTQDGQKLCSSVS